MPYKSAAQEKFFNANKGKKGLSAKVVKEFNRASKGMKLPQHAPKPARSTPRMPKMPKTMPPKTMPKMRGGGMRGM